MAQALVPLKDLVEAKSRLSGLLRPSERRALAQAMAEDVEAALELLEVAITLISPSLSCRLLDTCRVRPFTVAPWPWAADNASSCVVKYTDPATGRPPTA